MKFERWSADADRYGARMEVVRIMAKLYAAVCLAVSEINQKNNHIIITINTVYSPVIFIINE